MSSSFLIKSSIQVHKGREKRNERTDLKETLAGKILGVNPKISLSSNNTSSQNISLKIRELVVNKGPESRGSNDFEIYLLS